MTRISVRAIMLSALNGDPTAALQPAPDLLQPAITSYQQQQQYQQYQNYLRSMQQQQQQHQYQMDLWRQQQQQQQLATAAAKSASESPKLDSISSDACGSSPLKRPAESSSSSSCGSEMINKRRRKRVRRRVSLDSEQSWEPGALRDKPFKV